jgi:hypothetical protein
MWSLCLHLAHANWRLMHQLSHAIASITTPDVEEISQCPLYTLSRKPRPCADDGWRIPGALWEHIVPLLPPCKPHPLGWHRLRVDDRKAMDAIAIANQRRISSLLENFRIHDVDKAYAC